MGNYLPVRATAGDERESVQALRDLVQGRPDAPRLDGDVDGTQDARDRRSGCLRCQTYPTALSGQSMPLVDRVRRRWPWMDRSTRRLAITPMLPSCWEELLDWADDASILLLRATKSDESVTRQPSPPLFFVPRIHPAAASAVDAIASLTQSERAILFAQFVVMDVLQESPKGQRIATWTIADFDHYYLLLRRLAELQKLRKVDVAEDPGRIRELSNEKLYECAICYDNEDGPRDMTILSCGHGLCRTCEQRWCQRKLQCPFCRQSFASRRVLQQDGWQLAEKATVESLQEDTKNLQSQLEACLFSSDENKKAITEHPNEPTQQLLNSTADFVAVSCRRVRQLTNIPDVDAILIE